MGIFSRQHACPQHRNLEFNELEELPDPRHSGCKGGRQVTGSFNTKSWSNDWDDLGYCHFRTSTYIGDYHDPASNSRENVAGFEHCSSWGVNSKLLSSPGFITVNLEKTGPKILKQWGWWP